MFWLSAAWLGANPAWLSSPAQAAFRALVWSRASSALKISAMGLSKASGFAEGHPCTSLAPLPRRLGLYCAGASGGFAQNSADAAGLMVEKTFDAESCIYASWTIPAVAGDHRIHLAR